MDKYIGILLAFLLCSIPAGLITGGGIPLPSSYIYLIFITNLVFSFISIFMQTTILRLYEINVYEEKKGMLDYTFKYIAIFLSAINYHVQIIFNRTPAILNKLFASLFSGAHLFLITFMSGIFE